MIKQRRNRMRTRRYESILEGDSRLDVAEDICTALNIVDHFTDGDKWEVVYERGDDFITVTNTSVDDQMDGLFCEVEIDNIWATCFAPPVREGGDYVVIGRWRWMLPDILDRITALVGCGSDCALERRRNVHNSAIRNERRNVIRRGRRFNESAVYSQDYARRAQELEGLKDQALFDALQPGDILEGSWGYNRTITDYFIVKRKTAKRVVVHRIARKTGDQPGDSWGGWTVCPVLPPKEDDRKNDVQGMMSGSSIKIADYPQYLGVWGGDYGWENSD